MDFFEHQERARRNTLLLTFFFVIAVVLIIIAVYAVLAFLFLGGRQPATETDWLLNIKRLWAPSLFVWTTVGTLAIISTGTLYKMSLLSAGGEAVARMFGAEPINPQTSLPAERRLLNIVEEMAIASGMPVPRVYLLDEESINAFAAGLSTKDAIIGVTRGCMNLLSRDELQGVIAHEFSHILNGDMRLNLRLMGVLHGILAISLVGWWIFRISSMSSRSGVAGTARRKGGGNTLVIILAGLSFIIIGYIGVFFARLIKSAVSRQREFLADAASVQFTRNPGGLAGALKKIGGFITGGQISHPNAEEASHLFFADGLKHSFFNLMSTHPPLTERIHRIDPTFNGKFSATTAVPTPVSEKETAPMSVTAGYMADYKQSFAQPVRLDPDKTSQLVGRTDPESLRQTGQWLALLPPLIRAATHEPAGAEALIMAMLISRNSEAPRGKPRGIFAEPSEAKDAIPPCGKPQGFLAKEGEIRNNQLLYLEKNADKNIYKSLLELMPVLENNPPEWFLPLSDLALATLRILPQSDLAKFAGQLRRLVESDGTITLFEYMIQARVAGQIKNWTRREKESDFHSSDFRHHLPAMRVVLSTLAYYGRNDDAGAALAFTEGIKKLPQAGKAQILPKAQCGLQQVDRALSGLSAASPRIKKHFLDACCACVAHDGRVSISEAELLRAVAAFLDCPIPPFLPTEMPLPNGLNN